MGPVPFSPPSDWIQMVELTLYSGLTKRVAYAPSAVPSATTPSTIHR
jgi:hypothetical protein